MKKITTLKDALIYDLKGLYDSEKKLQKYLTRYEKIVISSSLKKALAYYRENTENRINKLKWVFQYLNQNFRTRANQCVSALLKENEEVLKSIEAHELRDAVLTGYIQRILHFNISTYGTCRAFSHELRLHNVEEILKEILTIEKEMDLRLSSLAINEINDTAYVSEINQ